MRSKKIEYTVIEDNAGGLHLLLFRKGKPDPFTGFTGFEYNIGSLVECLDALDNGDNASTWDGRMGDCIDFWEDYLNSEFGYEVICHNIDGQRTVNPDKMGRAGKLEFGIDTD